MAKPPPEEAAHALIFGVTLSGKSSLMAAWVDGLESRGIECAVLDQSMQQWPAASFVCHTPDELLAWLTSRPYHDGRKRAVFIDEGGQTLDPTDKLWHRLFCAIRHCGVIVHLAANYYAQAHPAIRSNGRRRFVFRCDDARTLARAWGRPEIADAGQLEKLHFYYVPPFSPTQKGRITFKRNKPVVEMLEVLKPPAA